ENRLFRVPRYGLPTEDGVFGALLAIPAGEKEVPGSSDDSPIILPAEVKKRDFRSLLKACCPVPGKQDYDLDVDEWMSVLKLANIWSLSTLRQRASGEAEKTLQGQGPMEKIVPGKKYHVSRWLMEGYEALGRREQSITKEERETLGMETYCGLVELRDRSWEWANREEGEKAHDAGFRSGFDFKAAVLEIFKEELSSDKEFSA
ncbi:hypothetical protein OF83DRAFT_1069170, partial [Amylostereum chailletii]